MTTYKTYHGTHRGSLFGIAPTGRKIQFETVDAMRVRNGQITEHWGSKTSSVIPWSLRNVGVTCAERWLVERDVGLRARSSRKRLEIEWPRAQETAAAGARFLQECDKLSPASRHRFTGDLGSRLSANCTEETHG